MLQLVLLRCAGQGATHTPHRDVCVACRQPVQYELQEFGAKLIHSALWMWVYR